MHASNLLFLASSVACANSVNLPMLEVFRLLLGFAGCPPLTLGGGTIADLQPPEKRGLSLSACTMGPLLVCPRPFAYPPIVNIRRGSRGYSIISTDRFVVYRASYRWLRLFPIVSLKAANCSFTDLS